MAKLTDARREAFCVFIASGMKDEEAHIKAGYTRSDIGSIRKLTEQQMIKDRIAELVDPTNIHYLEALQEADVPPITADDDPEDKESLQLRRIEEAAKNVDLTEEFLINSLKTNIINATADGKYSDVNKSVELLGNYMGGVFAKPKAGEEKKETKKEEKEKSKQRKHTENLLERLVNTEMPEIKADTKKKD